MSNDYEIAVDFMDMTAVARVMSIDARGNIELEVLPGSVESHADLLAHA